MLAVLGREPAELTKPAGQRNTGNRRFAMAVGQLLPSADKPQAAYPSMGRAVEEHAEVSFERSRVHIGNWREAVAANRLVQMGAHPRERTSEPRRQGNRGFTPRSYHSGRLIAHASGRPLTGRLRHIGTPPDEQDYIFLSGNEQDVAPRIAKVGVRHDARR